MAYALGYATGYSDALVDNGIMPTVEVLLETDLGVFDDISDDYRQVVTVRGRNRELDRFQAGTCQVTLSDLTRDYDPSNVAGPYYGKLKPMRRLNVRAHWAGTAYDVFSGFVDSFAHEYAGPAAGDATVTIYATDGFKVLEGAELASSAYAQEVLADGPAHWWRMHDAGVETIADSVAGADGTLNDEPSGGDTQGGADGLVEREPGTSITSAGTEWWDVPSTVSLAGLSEWTVEGLFRDLSTFDTSTGLYAHTLFLQDGATPIRIALHAATATAPGTFTVKGFADLDSPGRWDDGEVRHFAVTYNAGTVRLYVDGIEEDTAAATGIPDAGSVSIAGTVTGGGSIAWQEIAIYHSALSAGRILDHYDQLDNPWTGDQPDERIDRVLDAVGWPVELRDLDSSNQSLQPAGLDSSALEHLHKVAESDLFGALFMTAAGKVRFVARQNLWNRPQEALFGEGGGLELPYRSIRPEYTDEQIRNDIRISRLDGAVHRVEDAASVGEYMRRTYVVDGLLNMDDSQVRNAADFLLSEYKEPQRRVTNMVVVPRAQPNDLFPQVLGLELVDQIGLIDRPPGGGDPNEQDTSIERITHTVTPMWWETVWDLAPSFGTAGSPSPVGVWDVTNWDESRWGF